MIVIVLIYGIYLNSIVCRLVESMLRVIKMLNINFNKVYLIKVINIQLETGKTVCYIENKCSNWLYSDKYLSYSTIYYKS